jgi:hypothetical protein
MLDHRSTSLFVETNHLEGIVIFGMTLPRRPSRLKTPIAKKGWARGRFLCNFKTRSDMTLFALIGIGLEIAGFFAMTKSTKKLVFRQGGFISDRHVDPKTGKAPQR